MSPLGDHQRVDRLAYRYLCKHLDTAESFPSLKAVLANEGRQGPDGVKYSSEGQGHFYAPNTGGAELLIVIRKHYCALVAALRLHNDAQAATEASWLAHVTVDGLTPSHHFPYEAAVSDLTVNTAHVRDTAGKRFYIKGETMSDSIKKTWRLTGPRGLLTSHTLFETSMALALQYFRPRLHLDLLAKVSVQEIFQKRASLVNSLGLYEKFMQQGPTPYISFELRRIVGPAMVEAVTLLWAKALQEAST